MTFSTKGNASTGTESDSCENNKKREHEKENEIYENTKRRK